MATLKKIDRIKRAQIKELNIIWSSFLELGGCAKPSEQYPTKGHLVL